jgi:hypothetical protein
MVTIQKIDNHFLLEIKGMHKLWAFKSEIKIPCEHVIIAYQDIEIVKGKKGFRFPGTSIPGIIHAGTYLNNGETNFWDVSNTDNAIVIDLKDEAYHQIIIEVENTKEAIDLLNSFV